jgi:hypothetical protein
LKKTLNVATLFILLMVMSCATTTKEIAKENKLESKGALTLVDISGGLPRDGLWRQNISLVDMNGDGIIDIVAPPPRKGGKGESGENRPYIFFWSQEDRKWREGSFVFPTTVAFGYGGIAVGDLRRTGYSDIVLAIHSGPIVLLENDRNKGFVEKPFPIEKAFYSRTVEIADVNGDGWLDVIALSEGSFVHDYKPGGILIGINKEGKGWDMKTVEGSFGLFGDSMATGNLSGEGGKDILIAPLTASQQQKKPVWFGNGKGDFRNYNVDLLGDEIAAKVRAGDVDGDGRDEVVFRLVGSLSKNRLAAFKWTGESFDSISEGLQKIGNPFVFDLVDIYGDGKKELIVLAEKGIGIYKYENERWVRLGFYELPPAETKGAYDLRAGRNRDGSVFIVYDLGYKATGFNYGIRAYKVRLDGGKD